jgi:hypothetical protein
MGEAVALILLLLLLHNGEVCNVASLRPNVAKNTRLD